MGFFPNLFRNPSIGKVATAVVTGGLSLAVPQIGKAVTPIVSKLYDPKFITGAVTAAVTKNPAALFSTFAAPQTSSYVSSLVAPYAAAQQGVQPMGLNIGGILGQVGTIFGGNQNPYFQGVSNVANLASQFFPTAPAAAPSTALAMRPPPSVMAPMTRALGAVSRRFFDKYPNLAVAIQGFRNMGKNVTRKQLWGLLKRFGPELLITGGILTAAAISELMMAGPGHRRMNPGNAKALRRSLRRLESFHRLCVRADKFRGRGGRRTGKACKTGSNQFVRQG